ncbi:CLK4-associating serine/arginine rich protein [Tanacetum coccineum]
MDIITKESGVKRYMWLVYMDKKGKEEERRQKEIVKGDFVIRKLSRKEQRKSFEIGREEERESARVSGSRVIHHDPYRESRRSPTYEAYSRSRRSRSYSPSQSRRNGRGHCDDSHRIMLDVMSHVFPKLKQHETRIREIIAEEEASFGRTLLHGIKKFNRAVQDIKGKVISRQVERITKKRTKNKAKTTKPDSEWKRL